MSGNAGGLYGGIKFASGLSGEATIEAAPVTFNAPAVPVVVAPVVEEQEKEKDSKKAVEEADKPNPGEWALNYLRCYAG